MIEVSVSRVRTNILSNFAGNAWNALLSLIFVPLYIKLMGVEAFGLVGFFAMLQGLTACLDLGLSTTINREMARFSAGTDKQDEAADLTRTLEVIYWFMAVVVGLAVYFLAPLIGYRWINAGDIPAGVLRHAVELMGMVLVFQWPVSFYSGGMLGLQKQVAVNVVTIVFSTLRNAGVLVVLFYVSSSILAFFFWQALMSLLTVITLRILFERSRPAGRRNPAVTMESVKSVWRFAAGTNILSIQGAIVMQQDKVILSRLISLEQFGYYSFASAVAQNIGRLTGPVMTALFPRFAQLAETGNNVELARLFHRGCQLVAILIFPVMAVSVFFAEEILMAWTGNAALVDNSKDIFILMVLGVGMNVIMHMPSILQVSHGWLSLCLKFNTLMVIVIVPSTLLAGTAYGGIGAASVFLVYNLIQVVVLPHFIHVRLLPGEKWRWYFNDVCVPLIISAILAYSLRNIPLGGLHRFESCLWLAAVYSVTLLGTVLSTSEGRAYLKYAFGRLSGGGHIVSV